MSVWRRRLRRTRFFLQALLAFVLIGAALLMALGQLLLPWLVQHPERVSAFLAERVGRPVTIDQVQARWQRSGPLLSLHGVHIGAANPNQQAFVIPQAELALNFYAWFESNRSWNEFRVVGLELSLTREGPEAPWQLHGLGGEMAQSGGNEENPLFQIGSLVLKALHLEVNDNGRRILLGADELRLINAGRKHRVLGYVHYLETQSPPITLIVNYDQSDSSGELYLSANELDLGALLRGIDLRGVQFVNGQGRADIWAWWRNEKLDAARVEVDLHHLVLQPTQAIALNGSEKVEPHVGFDRLALGARWQRTENGWGFDLADVNYVRGGDAFSIGSLHAGKSRRENAVSMYELRAEALNLDALSSVAMLSDALSARLRQWLYAANPQGRVRNINLRFAGMDDFDLNAQIESVGWKPALDLPGMQDLTATVLGDQDAVTTRLPVHHAFAVELPRVFRQPFEFSEFSGDVTVYRDDAAWRVETPALAFEGAGYGGELRGTMDIQDDHTRPLVDLAALITHAETSAAKLFWPTNTMPAPVISWLDRALVSGQMSNARLVFRGDADDWPFRHAMGRFEARADIEDMVLNYHSEWPRAEHLRLQTSFVNDSMHLSANSGEVGANQIRHASADLPDLGEGQIDINLEGAGSGKTLLEFLKATPVGRTYAAELLGVEVGGRGQLGFHLHLPVKEIEQMQLNGNVALANADLRASQWNLRFDNANGIIRFAKNGFAADDLAVQLDGYPANFKLLVGGFTASPAHAAQAQLRGTFPVKTVLAGFAALDEYWPRFPGASDWTVGLNVEAAQVGGNTPDKLLTLSSDLRGTAIDLPAPLGKPAAQSMPISIALHLPIQDSQLEVKLDQVMQMRAQLPGPKKTFSAQLEFGGSKPVQLPTEGLLISGTVPTLDVSGWVEFSQRNGGGTNNLMKVDVTARDLQAFGRHFHDTALRLTPTEDEFVVELQGEAIDGNLHLPRGDLLKRGITAQFDRLHLLDDDKHSDAEQENNNPAVIPPLHISVTDLWLDQGHFGAARLESTPSATGMRIESFETHSPNVDMSARGEWNGQASDEHSRFRIDFSAENLGRMLDALGYAGVVDGGQTVAHIDAGWDGSPATFALAKLDGSLKIKVAEGRILDVNPGAGRLFGLFSLTEIPRRLSLDFSDFFRSGMSFTSIDGEFSMNAGNAYTEDLVLKGPAADIRIRGRTGLKVKDYDQDMEVMPHVGSTLPMVGAIAGGPVGAAAGLVLQGVLRNQINQVIRAHYRVQGSWEKPVITLIASEPVKPPAKEDTKAKPRASGNKNRSN